MVVKIKSVYESINSRYFSNEKINPPDFRSICLLQIFLEPLVLFDELFDAVIHKVIRFGLDRDEMDWSHVEAVPQALRVSRHGESSSKNK